MRFKVQKALCGLLATIAGPTCSGAGNPCADVDCGEHGLCAVRGNAAFCVCEQDYHFNGVSCVGDTDPCADATCLDEHRACSVVDGQPVCGACLAGYHEESGSCVGDVNCEGTATCNGHGTCDDRSGTVVCICNQGYSGDRCERCATGYEDYGDAECRPSDPCALDTVCSTLHRECRNNQGHAECAGCLSGYHEESDLCVPDDTCNGDATCNNHGTCDDQSGTVVCTCNEGYAGPRCEFCAPGYVDQGSGQCSPALDPCAADTVCAPQKRECLNRAGQALCGDCLAGYHFESGSCVPDCAQPTLTPIQDLPMPLTRFGSTAVRGGLVYILGGTSGNIPDATFSQKVYAYDTRTDTYVEVGMDLLPYGMSLTGAGLEWEGGKLYGPPAIGPTWNSGHGVHDAMVEIDVLAPSARETDATFPRPRWGTAMARGGNGFLYLFGAYDAHPNNVYDIYRYDPAHDTLTLLSEDLDFGQDGKLIAETAELASDGLVYVVGKLGSETNRRIAVFDPGTETVRLLTVELPCSAYGHFWERPAGTLWGLCRAVQGNDAIGFFTYDTVSGTVSYQPLFELPIDAGGGSLVYPGGYAEDLATGAVYFFGGTDPAGNPVAKAFRLDCVGPVPW